MLEAFAAYCFAIVAVSCGPFILLMIPALIVSIGVSNSNDAIKRQRKRKL